MPLHDALVKGARDYPERLALRFGEQTWTYAQLNAATDRLAAGLRDRGVGPGDRIALLFRNGPEIVCGYYACFKAGLIAVPLNTRMKGPELAYVLNHSGARLLLGQPDLYREVAPHRAEIPTLEACYITGEGSPPSDCRPYADLLATDATATVRDVVEPQQAAVILYTSGTTARPKGVVHTHHSLGYMVESCLSAYDSSPFATTAAVPPLCHMGSLGGALLATIQAGGTLLLFAAFDPVALLRAIEQHRVTCFWLLPIMHAALTQVPGASPQSLASVQLCLTAGDTMPDPVRARFREVFGHDVLDTCGMTELIYSVNPPGPAGRTGSIGLPLPGVRLRLVDASGKDVLRGEAGEILAQGDAQMQGYWNDPAATAAAVRDGWLHTGDLARQDEDGYYWFVGRKKDVIIRGGSNIAPAEVEEALLGHPGVTAAGVIGVPDPHWGQAVCAFVTVDGADADEEALKAHLRDRIAAYKVPERIQIVPALPVGLTGKIHRQTLREWAAGDDKGKG